MLLHQALYNKRIISVALGFYLTPRRCSLQAWSSLCSTPLLQDGVLSNGYLAQWSLFHNGSLSKYPHARHFWSSICVPHGLLRPTLLSMCAKVVNILWCFSSTYVLRSTTNLHAVCSSTQAYSSQVTNLQGACHMVPCSWG